MSNLDEMVAENVESLQELIVWIKVTSSQKTNVLAEHKENELRAWLAIQDVLGLHKPKFPTCDCCDQSITCFICDTEYPCETIKTVEKRFGE